MESFVQEEKTQSDIIDLLIEMLFQYPHHVFIADYQHNSFKKDLLNLNDENVLQVMDYSMNYLNVFQDEAQGAHWTQSQSSVHPVVCYYPCKGNECNDVVRNEIIVITDDLKHDAAAVSVFEEKVDIELQKLRQH